MKNLVKVILSVFVISATFISCDSDDSSVEATSGMSVRLVDAPGDYENVFIDVVGVEAIVDGEIVMMETNAGVYDLLTLTGGNFVSLVNEDIPSGDLSQVRLVLGAENSIVLKSGEAKDLQTPSAQQSGLKLNVNYDLQPGVTYEFIMDFKVDESVVAQGNGGFLLKPVIRITTSAESGAIAGSVEPFDTETKVTATNDASGEEISAYTDETGEFLLYGVPEGTYTLQVESESGLTATVNDVTVVIGETTVLEVIVL